MIEALIAGERDPRVLAELAGYSLRSDPQFDDPIPAWQGNARVAVFLEVKGNGDYLPPWAGNLDIMTAAAMRVGELVTKARGAVSR